MNIHKLKLSLKSKFIILALILGGDYNYYERVMQGVNICIVQNVEAK